VANDAFADMFGAAAGDAVGGDWPALLESLTGEFADPGYFAELAARLLADPDRSERLPLIGQELALADGRVVELDFAPIEDEQTQLGALWHFRDVTERAAVQRALEERNRSLAELAELRNVFVASVSHELRTPLTSVVSFAHLLAEESADSMTAEQLQLLDGIDRNAKRLLRLIEDLLLLVRLETHNLPMSFTSVEPPDIVRAAVTDREPIAAEHGLTLQYEVTSGPPLHCDELRVHQVLGNLISNAMKFTPTGGRVTVRAAPTDAGWRFEVHDTGIGIPAEDLDSMFARFSRASNASSQGVPGTGLGLVICQAIVARHGGRIALESTEGTGTRVTVWLPWRPPPGG
jgi:signal transduction histidine kinase